jgi:hypothetical protein
VREIEASRRAVDAAKPLDGFARRRRAFGRGAIDEKGGERLQILFGEAVRLGQQGGITERLGSERVEPRRKVAVTANRLCEIGDADDLLQRQASRDLLLRAFGWGRPRLEDRPRCRINR